VCTSSTHNLWWKTTLLPLIKRFNKFFLRHKFQRHRNNFHPNLITKTKRRIKSKLKQSILAVKKMMKILMKTWWMKSTKKRTKDLALLLFKRGFLCRITLAWKMIINLRKIIWFKNRVFLLLKRYRMMKLLLKLLQN
jgi:hypothetical protein